MSEREEEIPFATYLVGYLLILGGTLGVAIFGKRQFGLDPFAVGSIAFGIIYLLAAAQRPMIVYQVLRNVRWFATIRDTGRLRQIMFFFGVVLLLVGIFVPLSRLLGKG